MVNCYVSTIAFGDKNIHEIISIAEQNNFSLEFSSGLEYDSNMLDIYNQSTVVRMPHNYFPAPCNPFVLNLASPNNEINRKSVEHCKKNLILAKRSNSPFFAAHAGFCIDPNPQELGNKINAVALHSRSECWKFFISSLNEIIKFASEIQMKFLIENNVIARFNLDSNGNNPLFCCESVDILKVFKEVDDYNDSFGLLLDTAHLKVSCKALNLNLEDELNKIKQFITGIHHSDNNGDTDNNLQLLDNYWFLPHIKKFKDIVHVLEVKNINVINIKEQINLLNSWM